MNDSFGLTLSSSAETVNPKIHITISPQELLNLTSSRCTLWSELLTKKNLEKSVAERKHYPESDGRFASKLLTG